ncbi:hypothetical protein B0H16DRAFT_1481388 [Mycena metata]|uniref:Ubiquitin-like protease family profile domain-containing protein n=1 Tax=Mycena metata TaxID=1033252 RepID=A0AAD7MAX0_9AGAR|nr:hypothetical protein B0H16DRAFT_1481388 [Mycena metata]
MAEIEITDRPFLPADWIGKGKQYLGAPWEVINAKNTAFALPAKAAETIPDGTLPVLKFVDLVQGGPSLRLTLGIHPDDLEKGPWQKKNRQNGELVHPESQLWFSNEEATADISLLKGRSIPPAAVLDLLCRKSGQAWITGAKSITDPRFNDGAERFPLETLTYWGNMAEVIEEQSTWKRTVNWVNNELKKAKDGDTKSALEDVRTELGSMGWKAPLPYCNRTTTTLDQAEFLGSVWLRTTNVDIMMEDLRERVASDPELAAKVIVAPLAFSDAILGLKKGGEGNKLLKSYEREIREGGKEKIIFPANIGNQHWVGGEMDFKQATIGFGDSVPGYFKAPAKLIKNLGDWGWQRFGDKFQWDYDALEHGVQRDGFSCGIVTRNTVERKVYPATPLWIPRGAVLQTGLNRIGSAALLKCDTSAAAIKWPSNRCIPAAKRPVKVRGLVHSGRELMADQSECNTLQTMCRTAASGISSSAKGAAFSKICATPDQNQDARELKGPREKAVSRRAVP